MAATELSVSTAKYLPALRKATEIAIRINPRTIELVTSRRVDKGGGVYDKENGSKRDAQTFSIEPMISATVSAGESTGEVSAISGAEVQRWSYYLVGRYDAEMAVGDTWTEGNTTYRIVSINPKNDYEKRAVVTAFGPDPNYGA